MSSPTSPTAPLLPLPVVQSSRSRLGARRYTPTSEKAKGKQRADPFAALDEDEVERIERAEASSSRGRGAIVIFTNETEISGGNLEVWIDQGESVGRLKDKIRHLRPGLEDLNLRLIHSGRLLTDGILLLPWLRSLEDRLKRQAGGVGADVEEVLKDVGLDQDASPEQSKSEPKVWLHCSVGSKLEKKSVDVEAEAEDQSIQPTTRRGFDALLDAGLSPADVALMRRQFYEGRGEEVPEGLDGGIGIDDENARALEEQWIEGEMTNDTATTVAENVFSSVLYGLLTGFLFPLFPWFFFKELPLPNFFDHTEPDPYEEDMPSTIEDADAPDDAPTTSASSASPSAGATPAPDTGSSPAVPATPASAEGAAVASSVTDTQRQIIARLSNEPIVQGVTFGKRMQMGILIGTMINIMFGALRFLN